MELRVLHFTPHPFDDKTLSGFLDSILTLTSEQVETHLAMLVPRGDEIPGCQVHCIGTGAAHYGEKGLVNLLALQKRYLKLLYSLMPDIVHVHGSYHFLNSRIALWSRKRGFPVVFSPYGGMNPEYIEEQYGIRTWKMLSYQKSMTSGASAILTSDAKESEYIQHERLTDRVEFVSNPRADDYWGDENYAHSMVGLYRKVLDSDKGLHIDQKSREALSALLHLSLSGSKERQPLCSEDILNLRSITPKQWRDIQLFAQEQGVISNMEEGIAKAQLTVPETHIESTPVFPLRQSKDPTPLGSTLSISSPTGVTLKDASKITLVDANKKSMDILVSATGKAGEFNIAFNKLTPGTYTLTAAKGAFVYTLAGTELEIDAITASYTVEAAADIKWALSPVPGDYEAMNSLTLTFTSNKEIALADQSKVTLKNVLGMAVTLKDIKKDGNKFTISFDKLGTGPYTFEAAQGAFTYTFVGETMQVEAITAKYTILAPPEVAVAVYPGVEDPKHESLSSVLLTFTCTKPIELADASKVKLTDAEGHAVEVKNIGNEGNVYTIEFDELPSGNYTFSVEKGAFVYTFGGEEIPVDGIDAISYTVVPQPQVACVLTPASGSSLESLSSVALTLTADRTISLADKSKVTLTDEAGEGCLHYHVR